MNARPIAALAALLVLSVPAFAGPPKAKLSPKQAEAAAVKKFPGKAMSAVYENEDGHWQYAVIVRTKKGAMMEVAVNPTTGAIMSSEKTSAAEESKEAAADAAKAKKK